MSRVFAPTGLHLGEQAPDAVDSAGACLLVDSNLGALDVESGLTMDESTSLVVLDYELDWDNNHEEDLFFGITLDEDLYVEAAE